MFFLVRLLFFGALLAALTVSTTHAEHPNFEQNPITVRNETELVEAITLCLSHNKEALLFPKHVQCTNYREGQDLLEKEYDKHHLSWPTNANFKEVCPTDPINTSLQRTPQRLFDARLLSTRKPEKDILKILIQRKLEIGSHGIRIIGAIFCEKVELVGYELSFSLVLDHSIFKEGMELRNLHIKGDLSVDGSYIFKQLRILRSNIESSFYGDRSFIVNLSVSNSTFGGSVSIGRSVLFQSTQFDSVTITKELSLRASAISYFIFQFSTVGGLLDLSHSEARCAYHINKSEIGYLVAKRAGFGTPVRAPENINEKRHYNWRRVFSPAIIDIFNAPEVYNVVKEPDRCVNDFGRSYRAEFFIFDSSIKSSLCLSDFQWLAPRYINTSDQSIWLESVTDSNIADAKSDNNNLINYIQTVIAIDGNFIGNNLILDLWPDDGRPRDALNYQWLHPRLRKLELIGVKAGALIMDYKGEIGRYVTAIDGLEFERLYHAKAVCEYGGGSFEKPHHSQNVCEHGGGAPTKDGDPLMVSLGRKASIIVDFKDQLQIPKVEDVLRWLDLNKIESSQPYTAVASAFQKAGVDSIKIIVQREGLELCERAARWLPIFLIEPFCKNSAERAKRQQPPIEDSIHKLVDFAQFLFKATLWALADHGYRPGKVLWYVTGTLLLAWIFFLWPLKIVAYTSKAGSETERRSANDGDLFANPEKLRPIGFSFLLDRLLPAYQISGTHYNINKLYRRIPKTKLTDLSINPRTVRRLFIFKWPVEPVTDPKINNWVGILLWVLRILGLIYAIFLAAAISAMIVH